MQSQIQYLPDRLYGIREGDIVRIFYPSDIESQRNMRCGWNQDMDYLIGHTHKIHAEDMRRISEGHQCIFEEGQWSISLDMLELVTPHERRTTMEDTTNKASMSIKLDRNQDTIAEMISKVDIIRLKKLLTIGANSNNFTMKDLSQVRLDKILRVWAESKLEYYELFGHQFSIEKSVEVEMDELEMETKLIDLSYQYPEYCAIISQFGTRRWIRNECNSNSLFEKYSPSLYQEGMKLSKFLSQLLNNKLFDDSVAKLLENRKINSVISISIDPYDYLTMSLNNYTWRSCQKIGDGESATGSLSIMLDDTTLIAYKSSGVDVPFNYKNFKFNGNSKSWRQCIYFDKNTSGAIFSRQYPTDVDTVSKLVRDMLEERVSNYLGVPNQWILEKDSHTGYVAASRCLFHDCIEGYHHHQIRNKNVDYNIAPIFEVGENIPCLECGTIFDYNKSQFLCGYCASDSDREERDEDTDEYEEMDDDNQVF